MLPSRLQLGWLIHKTITHFLHMPLTMLPVNLEALLMMASSYQTLCHLFQLRKNSWWDQNWNHWRIAVLVIVRCIGEQLHFFRPSSSNSERSVWIFSWSWQCFNKSCRIHWLAARENERETNHNLEHHQDNSRVPILSPTKLQQK